MIDRFVEVASRPALVRIDTGRVVVSSDGRTEAAIPVSEVAVLSLAHPGILVSVATLGSLAARATPVVIGDDKRLPVAMVLPLRGNAVQAERFRCQAAAPLPLRKRLWQQVVVTKIRSQGELLRLLTGEDHGLLAMARSVRSGDPGNVEAQASRRY